MKKIFSAIFAAVMILSCCAVAFAADDVTVTMKTLGLETNKTETYTGQPGTEIILANYLKETPEGYKAIGWYSDEACTAAITGTSVNAPETSLTIYKKYEKLPEVKKHTLTIDQTTAGVKPENFKKYTVEEGKEYTLDTAVEGYTLLGLYLDKDFKIPFAPNSTAVTSDITVYANYKKNDVVTYEFTYHVVKDNAADTAADKKVNLAEGMAIGSLKLDGYEFIGFYEKFENGKLSDELKSPKMPAKAYSLYAAYKKEVVTYKVTFDFMNVKTLQTAKLAAGEKITWPDTKQNGVYFIGWYEDEAHTKAVKTEDAKMPEKDVTYYGLYAFNLSTAKSALEKSFNVDELVKSSGLTKEVINTLLGSVKCTYTIGTKKFTASSLSKLPEEAIKDLGENIAYQKYDKFVVTVSIGSKDTSTEMYIYNDVLPTPKDEPSSKNADEPTSTEPTSAEPTSEVPSTTDKIKTVDDDVTPAPATGSTNPVVAIVAGIALIGAVAAVIVILGKKKKTGEKTE